MLSRAFVCCLLILFCCASFAQKVLVFSKTAGYHHASIPAGIEAIKNIGAQNNFAVDTTTDASKFTDDNLKQYKVIIFLSTTGNLFDTLQKQSFQKYVRNGGGVAGIHAATDAEYKWPWYGKLMGGYFENHPKEQTAKVLMSAYGHPATKGLPGVWNRFDEWYNFKQMSNDVHVLLTLDERSYTGGKHGDFHPVSWWQDFEGGRMFYTALGHTDSSYIEPLFLQHLTGGILFVMNRLDANAAKAPSWFDPKLGLDKFRLGARLSSLDTSNFRRMSEPFTWKGKTELTYAVEQSVLIGNVAFQNLLLTFDGSNKLIRIQLFKMYRRHWDRDYKETAVTKYNELKAYLEKQLNKKGKKKKLNDYKDIYEAGYEWVHPASKTLVSLYEDTGKQSISDVRLQIESKE